MRQSLPLDNYEWLSQEEISQYDPLTMPSNESETGFIVEVTLDYPEHLHLEHNAFPLAPEHVEIDKSMLSPYASNVLQKLTRKRTYHAKKLTATFKRRKNYVCHGLNLKFYLEQGMKLIKIHRIMRFRQSPFIKDFIDMCTKKRAEAKTKTEKDFYKLLANSLYGKMIESGDNRMDCRFVSSKQASLLRNTDPRTQAHMIFGEDLSMAFMNKAVVNLNQSWAVGFTILELSKLHMQELFYNKIKPAFDGNVSVLLSDTDSWVMELPVSSPDIAMKKLRELGIVDTSNYPPDHELFSSDVRNLTGYLKNENPNDPIIEVIAVRSKTYCIVTQKDQQNKCKGVKSNVKDAISADEYRKCVQEITEHHVTQHSIQSKKHLNRLLKQKKLAFSSFDDKRFLLCSKHSVPYGSSLIERSRNAGKCFFCMNPEMMK